MFHGILAQVAFEWWVWPQFGYWVTKLKGSLDGVHLRAGVVTDPLVEARRVRDMGVLKSKLDNILVALERAGIVAN